MDSTEANGITERQDGGPGDLPAFFAARLLVAVYFGVSLLTFIAIVLMRDDAALVNVAAWIRGTIVAVTSVLMLVFAIAAGRGSARGYLRLRIVSAVMVVAIAVILAIPGTFPLWLKAEQALCGAILLAVVILINRREVRAAFAARTPRR